MTWPNGDIFGTICVLDDRRNEYGGLFRKFLFQCRDVLQADLKSLQANAELELKVLERTAELHKAQTELAHATRVTTWATGDLDRARSVPTAHRHRR